MDFEFRRGNDNFRRNYGLTGTPVVEVGEESFIPDAAEIIWYSNVYKEHQSAWGMHQIHISGFRLLKSGKPGVRRISTTWSSEDADPTIITGLPDWLEPVYAAASADYDAHHSSLEVAVACAARLWNKRMLSGTSNAEAWGARRVVEDILVALGNPNMTVAKHTARLIEARAEQLMLTGS